MTNTRFGVRTLLTATALSSAALAMPALGQSSTAQAEEDDAAIIVLGAREIALDSKSETGSRLGLTVRETPATIDVLTQERFLERGLRTSNEALNSAPGVTAIDTGGSPGTVSMRGFGGNSVSQNYDGVHQPSTMTSRNYDSFAFDRIEILKGPSSVLYGEGAVGGSINFVPKKPMLDRAAVAGIAQYGSLNTFRVAGDVNLPLSEQVGVRAVVSYAGTDGLIDRAEAESLSANLGIMFQPTDRLSLFVAAEYFWKDDGAIYWGTPLVSTGVARDPSDLISTPNGRVLDLALRNTNLQYDDAKVISHSTWFRSQLNWQINDVWSLRNDLSYNGGERLWRDAEGYSFSLTGSGAPRIARRATYILNPLAFWHERLALSSDGNLFGNRNRFLIGAEHSENEHTSIRRFGQSVPVDPYDFDPGLFPEIDKKTFVGAGNFTDAGALIKIDAVFAENAFNITDKLLFVLGGRYEDMSLLRTITDYNPVNFSSFETSYNPFSYRAGLVYDLANKTQLYAQYSRSAAPVGTLVLLNLANSKFELTKGETIEGGVKSSFLNDKVSVTLSGFWIREDDIITRDPIDPTIAIQGGSQSTYGAELAFSAALTSQFRIDGNVSLIDAKYDELLEAGGVNRAGNTPPNVAERIINLFAVYEFPQVPFKLTAGLRNQGSTFGDTANLVRVDGYTIFDASIGYRFSFGELTVRGRNLTDRLYIERAGTSSVYIGAPRTVDVTFQTKF
ncbi:TonB-dependent siderophore receptor [Altererythrobacter xixiisoli]|uniref:TonB-dependent siderophore receptor n=1 Tax=Croceibacterium xixiisoli TaxID=1476466 RepID=A0A6I4TTU0_9SPHN|nr:TonB-dependent siderophore receptor [Croceibacterium xixiisoli]MXO97968.1 TonB-dependent siderophore receptor [Croceibacterium xixiisoli]